MTHTIAYTLWGVQRTAEILGRSDGIAAVAKAANRIAQHLRQVGWLSAVLDHRWRTCAPYACLTGNALSHRIVTGNLGAESSIFRPTSPSHLPLVTPRVPPMLAVDALGGGTTE